MKNKQALLKNTVLQKIEKVHKHTVLFTSEQDLPVHVMVAAHWANQVKKV